MYRQIKLHPEGQNYQLILWYEHSLLLNSPLYSLYYKHKKQLFGQYNLLYTYIKTTWADNLIFISFKTIPLFWAGFLTQ